MKLYIVRHGLAGQHGDYEDDSKRPLTDEGRKKTREVAKRLKELGIKFDLTLSSPLARAYQTAEILLSTGITSHLEVFNPLSPGGNIDDFIDRLRVLDRNGDICIAIVGHEPDLSSWAELLIWGEAKGKLILKKAGIIGLDIPNVDGAIGQGQLFLLIPPRWAID